MNLTRRGFTAISQWLSHSSSSSLSSYSSEKWFILHPRLLNIQSPGYSKAKKSPQELESSFSGHGYEIVGLSGSDLGGELEKREWPRPTEIPYQAKVANLVHLIGKISGPVQIETLEDGRTWAFTVLVQQKTLDFPHLWIPIIFEGDMAGIAACHLKENDLIYVLGQLSAESPQFTDVNGQAGIQVMVHSISYVQEELSWSKKITPSPKQTEENSEDFDKVQKAVAVEGLWKELFAKPYNWYDNRFDKRNPRYPDFRNKNSKEALWLDKHTPDSVLSALESPEFCAKFANGQKIEKIRADIGHRWEDLFADPSKWCDNRKVKTQPTHPDFKHKETGEALWLDGPKAEWVLSKLKTLEIDQRQDKGHLWEDLFADPSKWCDNRKVKTQPTHPDFKHKETGEALWLDGIKPEWVLSKLKTLEIDQRQNKDSNDLWKDLVANRDKWWDNRLSKVNPKAPDFKHKDSGKGLWLNGSTPDWALTNLTPSKAKEEAADEVKHEDIWGHCIVPENGLRR
ncbi:protein OSB3, chloroplastic/mitochondrial isoform X4 [Amborella trichopoda]|uniref:protein OSB3, chloroplastic/mitochondrial isoform X4 n=1 Tax=Amborella trichopoda TaxID=13333 RepID=UPI0005D32F3F|nr:protein OSB3, chloroplastic/mitochondrial isoform X4 [Amborella trichopoda]|eukprot:XP_006845708.2 protein OSB3, chloroplastic/mitochondrial isoform X4 [Amborella trichopoda]